MFRYSPNPYQKILYAEYPLAEAFDIANEAQAEFDAPKFVVAGHVAPRVEQGAYKITFSELGRPPAYSGQTSLTIRSQDRRVLMLPAVDLGLDGILETVVLIQYKTSDLIDAAPGQNFYRFGALGIFIRYQTGSVSPRAGMVGGPETDISSGPSSTRIKLLWAGVVVLSTIGLAIICRMQIDPALISRLRSSLNEDAAIGLLRRFIGTPSVTGAEATFAQLLADELRSLGADWVTLVDFAPGRPNVRGLLRGQQTGAGPCLLIIGHSDTVHVRGWSEHWAGTERENPFSATIVDGAVWGRGAGDLKAGIATTLAAARLLAAAGLTPPADLLFGFVGDEESGEPGTGVSAGIKSLIEEIEAGKLPKPDFAVYVEPTRLNIYAAQMGFVICEISVIGRSAYFGVPELGLDALMAAHAVLSAVWAHSAVLEGRTPHALVGRPFVLATGLESGGYIAVPGESRISLVLKLLPGESLDDAVQGLEAAVRNAPVADGIIVSFAYPAGRDHRFGGTPTEVSPDLGPVRLLGRAVQAVRADRGLIEGAPYWSEAPFLINRLGVPAVYWAPGDIRNCHTLEERVLVKDYLDGIVAFAAFIAAFDGSEAINVAPTSSQT